MQRFLRRIGQLATACAVATLLASAPAAANPFDTFGYTSRAIAMGGGFTGAASSYEAAYYNPAGLARLSSPELGLGVLLWRPVLEVNGAVSPANRTRALIDAGLGTPIPLGRGLGNVLFLGVNLAFPGSTLYAIRESPPAEPRFPFLEDRNRRLVFNFAMAVRINRMFSLGAGLSLLPDVMGDVKVDLTESGAENSTSVDVRMHLSPNAGVLIEPIEGLAFGLVWRGANRTYLSIPVGVKAGEQLNDIDIRVLAFDYSTPHQIALGGAYRRARFEVAADLTYSLYRYFEQSSPTVHRYGADGEIVRTSAVGSRGLRDTWAVRLGGEYRVLEPWTVRAGFGWIQSPVPAQTGETNLLDGDRFTVSFGSGFDLAAIDGPPIRVDAHFAWTGMAANTDAKAAIMPENPGYPTIRGSGSVFSGGVTAKVRF
ncbi:MAG: outer membrane protein transport protein [Deltaproteobacteria bacterium]|nr:outer membrane protein transport protein [Deltaproteobacteria bacterium]